jgi:hypothetical protein
VEECGFLNKRRRVMDKNRDKVIPSDVAAAFYFTAYLEDLTDKDLRVLLAHYSLPSHEHLTYAQWRELTAFVEQWRQYGGTPQQAWQHWLHEKRIPQEPTR